MAVDYKIEFRDVYDDFWRVWIRDTTGVGNTVTNLKAATTSPLRIKTVNNAEDALTPIRAKEVQIHYLDEGTTGVELFSGDGPDNKWRVEVEHIPVGSPDTIMEFIGFLQLDDLSEPMRVGTNVVELTATDKLGSLKDVPIKDFNGNTFWGIYSLITILAMALKRTGLALNINVCSSLTFTSPTGAKELFEFAFIDSKLFDTISLESTNCHDVLSKIFAGRFYITQSAGEWYIVDVDDLDGAAIALVKYGADGVRISTGTLAKTASVATFLSDPAKRVLNRPVKYVSTKYKIDTGDLLLNQDAKKGDLALESIYVTGATYGDPDYTVKHYILEGWTLQQVNRTTGVLGTPNAWAKIRRNYVLDSENSRHIEIYKVPDSPLANIKDTGWNDYILENNAKVPIRKGDKIVFSLEAMYPGFINTNPFDVACAQVLLFTTDSKVYTLIADNAAVFPNGWKDVTSSGYNKEYFWRIKGVLSQTRLDLLYGSSPDAGVYGTHEWATISNDNKKIGSQPAPADGVLKIRLCSFISEYENGVIGPNSTYNRAAPAFYRNIKLDVKSVDGFLTGAAQGWYYRAERSGEYNNKETQDIDLDNTRPMVFAGCLLQTDSNAANLYGYTTISQINTKNGALGNYGAILARTIWNQHNRALQTVKGTIKAGAGPSNVTQYTIDGIANKKFMLLGYDWDVRAAQVSGATFKEVHDTVIGKEAKEITRHITEPQ